MLVLESTSLAVDMVLVMRPHRSVLVNQDGNQTLAQRLTALVNQIVKGAVSAQTFMIRQNAPIA